MQNISNTADEETDSSLYNSSNLKTSEPEKTKDSLRYLKWLLDIVCGVTTLLLIYMIIGPLAISSNADTSPMPYSDNSTVPNVGYTLYAPSYLPTGLENKGYTTFNIRGQNQVFQSLEHANVEKASIREGDYNSIAADYWTCNLTLDDAPCEQIGQTSSGNTVYEVIIDDIPTWGVILGGTYINIEPDDSSVFTSQDAIKILSSLTETKPSKTAQYVPDSYVANIKMTKSVSLLGDKLHFVVAIVSIDGPYANKPARLDIGVGRSDLATTFASMLGKTNSSGVVKFQQVVPWALISRSYNFGVRTGSVGPIYFNSSSVLSYKPTSIAKYFLPFMLIVFTARILLGLKRKPLDRTPIPSNPNDK